jgi:hypothetical protein
MEFAERQTGGSMTSATGQPLPRYALVFIAGVAALALCYIVARLHGTWSPPPLVLGLALGWVLGLVCHELGHALCAVLGSIPVRLILVGSGPRVWRGRIRETWFELRLLPWGGSVSPYHIMSSSRFAHMFFVLGGTLGNVAIIGVAVALDAAGVLPQASGAVLGPVVAVQLFKIVMNLDPTGFTTQRPNDGMLLLQLLRQPYDYPARVRAAHATMLNAYGNGNLEPPTTSASSRLLYQVSCPDRITNEEARRDFREALVRELERGALTREEKMLALDSLITDGLIISDDASRAHLDAWSLQALALAPTLPTLIGSRGAALVALGQYEAGKALLAPLVISSPAGSFDAFMSQAFLALAEHTLGDEAEAQRLAQAARTTAEAFEATPRMAAMLARLERDMQQA